MSKKHSSRKQRHIARRQLDILMLLQVAQRPLAEDELIRQRQLHAQAVCFIYAMRGLFRLPLRVYPEQQVHVSRGWPWSTR